MFGAQRHQLFRRQPADLVCCKTTNQNRNLIRAQCLQLILRQPADLLSAQTPQLFQSQLAERLCRHAGNLFLRQCFDLMGAHSSDIQRGRRLNDFIQPYQLFYRQYFNQLVQFLFGRNHPKYLLRAQSLYLGLCQARDLIRAQGLNLRRCQPADLCGRQPSNLPLCQPAYVMCI